MKMATLQASVLEQAAAIHQDYDAKERSYDQAMGALRPAAPPSGFAPSYTQEVDEPAPERGFFDSLLSWFS